MTRGWFFSQKEFLVKLTRLVGFVVQCRSFYNYVRVFDGIFSSKLATSESGLSMAFESREVLWIRMVSQDSGQFISIGQIQSFAK